MTRTRAVLAGLATGVLVASVLLLVVGHVARRGRSAESPGVDVPAHLRPAAAPPETGPSLPLVDVTYYQRAEEGDALVPVHGRIVDLPSPVDRARELVRLVLEGPPADAAGAVRPAPPGIEYREVYLDPRGIAWVDFRSEGPWSRMGSDEERALLACLARTLVRGIPLVRRVGFLVEGETRRTLAGHVDLSRTWTGDEWPVPEEEVPLPGEGLDGSTDGTLAGGAAEPVPGPDGAEMAPPGEAGGER